MVSYQGCLDLDLDLVVLTDSLILPGRLCKMVEHPNQTLVPELLPYPVQCTSRVTTEKRLELLIRILNF